MIFIPNSTLDFEIQLIRNETERKKEKTNFVHFYLFKWQCKRHSINFIVFMLGQKRENKNDNLCIIVELMRRAYARIAQLHNSFMLCWFSLIIYVALTKRAGDKWNSRPQRLNRFDVASVTTKCVRKRQRTENMKENLLLFASKHALFQSFCLLKR